MMTKMRVGSFDGDGLRGALLEVLSLAVSCQTAAQYNSQVEDNEKCTMGGYN